MPPLPSDEEARKKAIFDQMSPRVQKIVRRKGYEKWNPFQEPKDPIDLREGKLKGTAVQLAKAFLVECPPAEYSNPYGQGVWEICLGLINDDEKYRGMYEFAVWYAGRLKEPKA